MAPRRRPKPPTADPAATDVSPLPAEYEPDGWPILPYVVSYDRVRRLVIERTPDGAFVSACKEEDSALMRPYLELRAVLARASRR